MGLFGKKKRMIDVRELQRRGIVKLPASSSNESQVVTDNDGFVQMNGSGSFNSEPVASPSSNSVSSTGNFFGFMDSTPSASTSLPSRTTPSEDLRKISQQISDLDNKIYKMEQRIELLERKAGVGGL